MSSVNNNNWQRCPVCNGNGKKIFTIHGGGVCNVCDGHGIISTLSGAPPGFKKNETSLGSTTELPDIFKPRVSRNTTNPNIDYTKNIRAEKENKDTLYAVKPYKQTEWVALFRNKDNADKFAKSTSGGEWYVIEKVEVDIDVFKNLLL